MVNYFELYVFFVLIAHGRDFYSFMNAEKKLIVLLLGFFFILSLA